MRPLSLIPLFTILLVISKRSEHPGLACILKSDKIVYAAGELPKFTVEIINNSSSDIYLIGSLDGSDMKWRYPYCYYTIQKPRPDTLKVSRCGTLNPLRTGDFKLVRPGEKLDPYQVVDNYGFFNDHAVLQKETYRNPGIYKIKFYYSTNTADLNRFIGSISPDNLKDSSSLFSLLKQIPKVELSSNEIEIRVEE